MPQTIPYCGAPPLPTGIWTRWNLDPVLISVLAAAVVVYAVGAGRAEEQAWRRNCFYAGAILGTLALVSPLCPLSVSLFAARIGQHMALMLLAAPLVALGRPVAALLALLRVARPPAPAISALFAAAAFAVALWYWHAPGPYAATFGSTAVYWLMHASLFATAAWTWDGLLNRPAGVASAASAAVTMLQMGFLGSLISLAPRPLYTPHALTTAAWGLAPLQDQQLGGAIMWAPGGAVFLVIAGLIAWRALSQSRPGPAAPAFGFRPAP